VNQADKKTILFPNFSDPWQCISRALRYDDLIALFIAVTALALEALGSMSEIPSRINSAA
jgi:hypothetical protein